MSYKQRLNKISAALRGKRGIKLVWLEPGEEPPPLEPGEEIKEIILHWDIPEAEPQPQPPPA